jgi:hypothetical protein
VPGVFNLQVTGVGFARGSRVLWNCNTLACRGAGERTTRWASRIRLDADVNFGDVRDSTNEASPRVLPVTVLNLERGARLTNCFRFSVVELTTDPRDPGPGQPFTLEVRRPPANGAPGSCRDVAVRFDSTSKISIDGKLRSDTVVSPPGCGFAPDPPCTRLTVVIPAEDSVPGRHLITVPRQFDSGEPSTDNAQPAAAILVLGQGTLAGERRPKLAYLEDQGFAGAGVKPRSGPENKAFTFRVKYRDTDGHPPFTGSPRVHIHRANAAGKKIAGSPFRMDFVGTSQGWAIYEYTHVLGAGAYRYKFSAEDSTGEKATGPPTSFKPGPTSQASD